VINVTLGHKAVTRRRRITAFFFVVAVEHCFVFSFVYLFISKK
jgi:hypothetical protein